MGKTTRYHPVSLHVLRGSVEWHGFKFGRLVQLTNNFEKATARYQAVLTAIPPQVEKTPDAMRAHLALCFLESVKVVSVYYGRRGWVVELNVMLETEYGQLSFA